MQNNLIKKKKKIILAAGIFYPDVGGPAIHTRKIAEALSANGWTVRVIAYGKAKEPDNFSFSIYRVSRGYPGPLRWFIYFGKVLYHSFGADFIYAFDPTAAGFPAALAAKLLGKKFLIRVGGDPIWERIVEHGKRFLTIDDYYQQKLYLQDKPILYRMIKWVLAEADQIIVYSGFFKNFYEKYFSVDSGKIFIIPNPVFRREAAELPKETIILFAGRFVKYKNLEMLIKVFDRLWQKFKSGKLVLIGDGPERENLVFRIQDLGSKNFIEIKSSLDQEKLFQKIRAAAVCVGPALSEFNPNFILECLSFGKPAILSQGNGLTVKLPDEWLFDPKNEKDLENKLAGFFDKSFYQKATKTVEAIPMEQTWENVIDRHLELINKQTAKR